MGAMLHRHGCIRMLILFFVLLNYTAICRAGSFTVGWHANPEADLQGYYLYYKANTSVVADATDATKVDIPLTKEGFDRAKPSYTVTDLEDGVNYYFAVSAYNHSGESTFEKEISGASNSAQDGAQDSSSGSGSCFVSVLP